MVSPTDKKLIYRDVARLHSQCIDQGFLPTLGPQFLALLYEAIDAAEDSVLLTHREGDAIVGFVAGVTSMRSVYRRLLLQAPRLVAVLLPSLLSPSRLWRIIETFRYVSNRRAQLMLPSSELLSIAVLPAFRGSGVAERLYRELCETLRSRGVPSFRIAVGQVLTGAVRFYERMGARQVASIEVHKGAASLVFVQQLD